MKLPVHKIFNQKYKIHTAIEFYAEDNFWRNMVISIIYKTEEITKLTLKCQCIAWFLSVHFFATFY